MSVDLVAPEALVVEGIPLEPPPPLTGPISPPRVEVSEADVLERAADILSEFDWQQHASGSRAKGAMCAIGAVAEAANDLRGDRRAFDHSGKYWEAVTGSGVYAEYNDAPGRTKAEVVAKLRQAASHARAQELGGSAAARSAGGQ